MAAANSPPSSSRPAKQRGLRLFVLPPRSPKLNGAVGRAQRNHTEEFSKVLPCSLELPVLNRELGHWGHIQIPFVPTKPWAISPRSSSCCGTHLREKTELS